MIPRKIHQVYGTFEDNKLLEDIPIFKSQTDKTKLYCEINNISYKLWLGDDCRNLLQKYPQYIDLYNNFRHKIMRADFIRYLILYDEGGIYVDCDISPIANSEDIDELFTNDIFFVRWNNDKRALPYNAVLGSQAKHIVYDNLLNHLIQSYEEKSKLPIYDKWVGRFVFQTTGHHMIQRVLKKYPMVKKLDILHVINPIKQIEIIGDNPLFLDNNASEWY
tara:strand:- start:1707 stop:2366 length:660 start_codon:yes stop_codon:yes gene_type:complete